MPKFVVFFKNLHAKLPLPTLLLIKVSEMSQKLWYVWVALFVGFIALLVWMHKSAKGRLHPRPAVPARAAGQGRRAVRGHRARVPDHRRDGEGRRAAARDAERGDPGHEQPGVRDAAS